MQRWPDVDDLWGARVPGTVISDSQPNPDHVFVSDHWLRHVDDVDRPPMTFREYGEMHCSLALPPSLWPGVHPGWSRL